MKIKIEFKKNGKAIKIYEEKGDKVSIKPQKKKSIRLNYILNTLAGIATIIGVIFAGKQTVTNTLQATIDIKQLELDDRKFKIELMPNWVVSEIQTEDRYDESKYRSMYKSWLYENGVKDFIDWQYENWLSGKIEYEFNPYQFLSKQEIAENFLSEKEIWRYNKYISDSETAKYFDGTLKEKDVPANRTVFWDAYIDNDEKKLSESTNGEFEKLQKKYEAYLSTSNFKAYKEWKNLYNYATKTIVLENTGAVINNATLRVYIFMKYNIKSDQKNYLFGINMANSYISEYNTGKFDSLSYNYDTKNKTFILKFDTYEQCSLTEYNKLNTQLFQNIFNKLNTTKGEQIIDYFANIPCVYFSVTYLDIEQKKQKDWYLYDLENDTLQIAETYVPDQEAPEYQILDLDYEAENSAYIAKILGFTNSQYKMVKWFDLDYTYIDQAEEKITKDIEMYFGK